MKPLPFMDQESVLEDEHAPEQLRLPRVQCSLR